MMFVNRLKRFAALALAAILAVAGGGLVAHRVLASPRAEPRSRDTPGHEVGRANTAREGAMTPLGAWRVIAMEVNGKKLAADEFPLATVEIVAAKPEDAGPEEFTANKVPYTITMAGKEGAGETVPCALRPGKEPKEIDIAVPGAMLAGAHRRGIYRLEKGRLEICWPDRLSGAGVDGERPKDFSGKAGYTLVILEQQ